MCVMHRVCDIGVIYVVCDASYCDMCVACDLCVIHLIRILGGTTMNKPLGDIVKKQDVNDIIDFIIDGNQSDCSVLQDDDDDDEFDPKSNSNTFECVEGSLTETNEEVYEDSSSEEENMKSFKDIVNNLREKDVDADISESEEDDPSYDIDDEIPLEDLDTSTRKLRRNVRVKKQKPCKPTNLTTVEGTSEMLAMTEDRETQGSPAALPSTAGKGKKKSKPIKRVYRWRRRKKTITDTSFVKEFTPPTNDEIDMTPDQYFIRFFPESLIRSVVNETNLYSVQKQGKSVDTNLEEMKTFLGMNILMGIIKLPAYTDYWNVKLRIPQIADVMPRNRFSQLRVNLHFVDNNKVDKSDKLGKIRPIIEAVRNECIKVEPEENQSVDEQIVPSKTKRTKIRQYNPKKPKKWGFKNLVRAGASGFMYDFYVYAGKDDRDGDDNYNELQNCAKVVARLAEHLPNNEGHKLFFDNWFSTLELFHFLKARGIWAAGTMRSNRLEQCPVENDKLLVKKGRGSVDEIVDFNSGLTVVKWIDNGSVLLCSNFIGSEPMSTIKRWNKDKKERRDIDCPAIVKEYNQSMGGVDLADMLIALHRIDIKTKRWYLKLFFHLVDIAKVNGWILYRRHATQQKIPVKKQMALKEFTITVAEALMHSGMKTSNRIGRPSKRSSGLHHAQKKRGPGRAAQDPIPCDAIRMDRIDHLPIPIVDENKKRCRLPGCSEYSRTRCEKCNVALCFNAARNCFKDFHVLK